jgi:hypothetical protein
MTNAVRWQVEARPEMTQIDKTGHDHNTPATLISDKTRHTLTTEHKATEDKTRQHTQDNTTQQNTTLHNTHDNTTHRNSSQSGCFSRRMRH